MKQILVVDDEPRMALTLCRALEHPLNGEFEVEISPVAETALARLKKKAFDLLVADLHMPGMGGLALLRQMNETYPQTRLMLISAYGTPDVEKWVRERGITYLPKPFSLWTFVATVERILDEQPLFA